MLRTLATLHAPSRVSGREDMHELLHQGEEQLEALIRYEQNEKALLVGAV